MSAPTKTSWYKNAVVYHIYPRSFRDASGDGVGDLLGIIEKLDYLNNGTSQSLGVNAIWLSPVYSSPMVDFGYDVSNYIDIDPLFGTLTDFDQLLSKAHKRNIKIIMDFIPNHTSSDHPWFIESKATRENQKRDWYIWRDPKPDGSPPNNWLSIFGGSAWEYDKKTNQYYLHSFTKRQPDLNWRNVHVQEAMCLVLRFWLDRGVDGIRFDAIWPIGKKESLPDDPPNPNYIPGKHDPFHALLHIYSEYDPFLYEIIKKFNTVIDSYDDRMLVTEAWADLPNILTMYKKTGTTNYTPFNFNFITMNWNAQEYKRFVDTFEASLRPEELPNYVLGNHDKPRVVSRLGEKNARLAAMLLLTLRGMAYVYYGDEIGMEDTPIPPEKIQDPFEKNVPGMGLGRDPERTPMQWDASPHAGFSSIEPWLPVNDNYTTCNVVLAKKDPTSMYALYHLLIALRKTSHALLYGKYVALDFHIPDIFGFIRDGVTEKMMVILNFGDNPQIVTLPHTNTTVICNSFLTKTQTQHHSSTLTLKPHEGYILQV